MKRNIFSACFRKSSEFYSADASAAKHQASNCAWPSAVLCDSCCCSRACDTVYGIRRKEAALSWGGKCRFNQCQDLGVQLGLNEYN